MRINFQIIPALENIYARFNKAPTAAREAALRAMDNVGILLLNRVRQNLSGDILKARTGDLRASMQYEVYEAAGNITTRVYSDGSVPYARILETGGVTRPHEIVVRNAKALRYEMLGGTHFSHSVQHPGSKIPAFMYLRMAMSQERTTTTRMLREAMKDAI